jgi:hypothetical protein
VKLTRWQRLACWLFCPRWKEDRPADEAGRWVACSILVTHRGRFERDNVEVEGLVNAYEMARWLALKLAGETHHEHGVDWAIRPGNDPAQARRPADGNQTDG